MVEFAFILPFLLLVLLGIIEFGLLFGQYNEIRHGVREGARYAAVSNPDLDSDTDVDADDVIKATCDSINLPGATVKVSVTADETQPDRLDYATLTVQASTESLSGAPLISSFIPSQLTNTAQFRLEQDADWSTFGLTDCP